MFEFLGRIGKGWGTISGVVIAVIGALLGTEAAQQATQVSEQLPGIVQGVGAILAAFGIGRKAGVAVR